MMSRWTMLSLLALALAACGQETSGSKLPPASGEGAPPRPELPPLPAAGGDDTAAVAETTGDTTGTTYPIRSAAMGPNMSGVIAKIEVDEGDAVSKGDVLFRLRTQDISLRIKQAETALNAAKVRLSAVDVEYQRTKRLFEKNALDQATWDRVQAERNGALAGVEAAQAGVAVAKQARTDATVRSPIDGVVTAKLKNVGEMVTMMPPTVVIVVEDHSVLELRFRLPERALASLKVGDEFEADFQAIGQKRAARVSRISPTVDQRTRTVEVFAEIPNGDKLLKAGMLAKVRLVEGDAK